MELLLDTHVCLWWASEPTALSAEAREAIADPANAVWVSVASAWELSIKVRAGKLRVDVENLFAELAEHGFGVLGIGVLDAVQAGGLQWDHRDPFDRMLAAQARRTGHVLVTRDEQLGAFLADASLPA